jgi:hypothetical protein
MAICPASALLRLFSLLHRRNGGREKNMPAFYLTTVTALAQHLCPKFRAIGYCEPPQQVNSDHHDVAPTPERRVKGEEGWSVDERPGGLKTYRALTPYDRASEGGHFSALEQDAALQLLRDLEFSGSMRVVVSRVYDGMPYAQPLAGASLKSQAQWAAAERLSGSGTTWRWDGARCWPC